MTEKERIELKEKINREIEKLRRDITELKDLVKPIAPENAIGRISRMDAINNRSINEAALRKAEIRLNALTEAKAQIKNQDYGKCVRCGEDIPIGRLLLQPQSRSCVKCAY